MITWLKKLFQPLSLVAWERVGHDYVFQLSNGRVYRGECTLWLDASDGSHAPLGTHGWLMQLETQAEWGRLEHLRKPGIWKGQQ